MAQLAEVARVQEALALGNSDRLHDLPVPSNLPLPAIQQSRTRLRQAVEAALAKSLMAPRLSKRYAL